MPDLLKRISGVIRLWNGSAGQEGCRRTGLALALWNFGRATRPANDLIACNRE